MKILVTGGTGFIGERLVAALVRRGDDVTVLSRRAGGSGKVRQVVWTPEQKGPWLDEVAAADAVIHLAGAGIMDRRWSDEHLRTCRDSRVLPTALISEALAARGSGTLVSASAVGYYGFRDDDRTCDESSPEGDDVLAHMCAEWEASTSAAESAGVRVSRARIGVVLGSGGGALAQMLPVFKLGLGGPLGNGRQMLPWIAVDDAVRALLFALDTPGFEGAFNVTAPTPVSMNHFAKELGAALGRPAFFRVPGFALRAVVGGGASVVLTGQNAVPKKLLDSGFSFCYPELGGALRAALTEGESAA